MTVHFMKFLERAIRDFSDLRNFSLSFDVHSDASRINTYGYVLRCVAKFNLDPFTNNTRANRKTQSNEKKRSIALRQRKAASVY